MGRAKKQIEKKKKKVEKLKAQTASGSATVARNKKAGFDFKLGKDIIAGIVLQGSEVKSLRLGNAQMKGAFAKIIDGEVFLFNCNISEYSHANIFNHQPDRVRKLLLNRIEIERLEHEMGTKNQTLVASKLFFKSNRAKVLLHLAEGKNKGDKRETLKKRQQNMDIKRAIKDY